MKSTRSLVRIRYHCWLFYRCLQSARWFVTNNRLQVRSSSIQFDTQVTIALVLGRLARFRKRNRCYHVDCSGHRCMLEKIVRTVLILFIWVVNQFQREATNLLSFKSRNVASLSFLRVVLPSSPQVAWRRRRTRQIHQLFVVRTLHLRLRSFQWLQECLRLERLLWRLVHNRRLFIQFS